MTSQTPASNVYFAVLFIFLLSVQAFSQEEARGSRDSYFPNTEILGEDEMRVVALGTGTPNFRRSQASAS